MNKTQTTIAVIGGVVVGTALWQIRSLDNQVANHFPQIDRKIAKKAWRKMFRDALLQRVDLDDYTTDAQMDKLFLEYVEKVS